MSPTRILVALCAWAALSDASASAQLLPGFERLDSGTGERTDYFGLNLSLSGDRLAVGALRADAESGRVYLFEKSGGLWERVRSLHPPQQTNPRFGFGLKMLGDVLLASDYGFAWSANSIYAFERRSGQWEYVQTFQTSGAAGERNVVLAMAPDVAVIGAPWADHPLAPEAGAIYIFHRVAGHWREAAKLFSARPFERQHFGGAAAISGDDMAVAEVTSAFNRGAVHMFVRTPSGWVPTAVVRGSASQPGDSFGKKIALEDGLLAVGAPEQHGTFSREGAVHVYRLDPGGWTQDQVLYPVFNSPGWYGNNFGSSVAVSRGRILAGAPKTSDGGQFFLYHRTPSGWEVETSRTGDSASIFGLAVDFNERWLVSGAPDVYGLSDGPRVFAWTCVGNDAGSRYCVGTENSTGRAARLRATRDPAQESGNLSLVADNLPGETYGVFLASRAVGLQPWFGGGHGHLCLASPYRVVESRALFSCTTQEMVAHVALHQPPLATPYGAGETWYFQLWYRDQDPLATTNTSDAVAVSLF